jgi:hypothetical protein
MRADSNHSKAFPLKTIITSNGVKTIVDDDDFEVYGKLRWKCDGVGYVRRNIRVNGKHKTVYLHRLVIGDPHGYQVDHKNGNKVDNRKENLRKATGSQQRANTRLRKDNPHGLKGVTWIKNNKNWVAQICLKGRHVHLGVFTCKKEAAKAYDRAALKHFGEFACTNFGEQSRENR